MIASIDLLKFNLQETQFPYFSDDDLQILLDKNNDNVVAASYEGCILKSQNDAIKLGPLSTNSNEKYWIRLSLQYQVNTYVTSRKRSDGQ